MEDTKINEIKAIFQADMNLTPNEVMLGYIFGTYGKSEHYLIDEFVAIKQSLIKQSLEVLEE